MNENQQLFAFNVTSSTEDQRRFRNTSTSYRLTPPHAGGEEAQAPTLGWSTQGPSGPLQPWNPSLFRSLLSMQHSGYPTDHLTAQGEPISPLLGLHPPATGHSSPASVSPDLTTFGNLSISIEDINPNHDHGGPRRRSSSSSLNIGLTTFDIPLQDGQDKQALSPILFATQNVDDSPLDSDSSVLYNDQGYRPIPEVGPMFEYQRPLFRSGSGRSQYSNLTTSSSEGLAGSSPSSYSSLMNSFFINTSTSHSSSSLIIPSDGEVPGADNSGGKWARQMTMPLPVLPYTPPTGHLYQPSHVQESSRRHSFPPEATEPRSFLGPNIQLPHDLDSSESSPKTCLSGTSSQALASDAVLAAANKRRTKIPRFSCSFCPQMLTSRDNLLSHEDIHNNIKRYPCEQCGRRFRTRAVLKRHYKGSRCLGSGPVIMAPR